MSINLTGQFAYQISGDFANVQAARVENTSNNRISGTLRLELWALPQPYGGSGPVQGFKLAQHFLQNATRSDDRLGPGEFYFNINFTERLINDPNTLPNGDYAITLFVTEFTGAAQNGGYSIADFGNFNQGIRVGPFGGAPAVDPDAFSPPLLDPNDDTPVTTPPPPDPNPAPPPVDTGAPESLAGDNGANKLRGGSADDVIRGLGGNDKLFGRGGDDRLIGGSGDDTLKGGGGDDKLRGGGGEDVLNGGGKNDNLKGGGATDVLTGKGGDDQIAGGGGDDIINGGRGDDTLSGGGGRDVFVFAPRDGNDVIRDFQDGLDRIQIRADAAADLSIDEVGGQTVLTIEGARITLIDTPRSQIDDSDFIF